MIDFSNENYMLILVDSSDISTQLSSDAKTKNSYFIYSSRKQNGPLDPTEHVHWYILILK